MKTVKSILITLALAGMLLVSCDKDDSLVESDTNGYRLGPDTNQVATIRTFYPLNVTTGDSVKFVFEYNNKIGFIKLKSVYLYKDNKYFPVKFADADWMSFGPMVRILNVPNLPFEGEYKIIAIDTNNIRYVSEHKIAYSKTYKTNVSYNDNIDNIRILVNSSHGSGMPPEYFFAKSFNYNSLNSYVTKQNGTTKILTDNNFLELKPMSIYDMYGIYYVLDKSAKKIKYLIVVFHSYDIGNWNGTNFHSEQSYSFSFKDLPYTNNLDGTIFCEITPLNFMSSLDKSEYSYEIEGTDSHNGKTSGVTENWSRTLDLSPNTKLTFVLADY